MNTRLSIATDFDDDGGPIEPKLAQVAAAGFTHIHWCEHWSKDVLYEPFYTRGVGRALKRFGLKPLDVHNAQTQTASPSSPDPICRERGVRLLRNRLEFTAQLGGAVLVIHPTAFDLTRQYAALAAGRRQATARRRSRGGQRMGGGG